MSSKNTIQILDSILKRIGKPGLAETLIHELSGTEFNTLMLEVLAQRANNLSPGDLLRSYKNNRLVKPVDLPVLPLREMEIEYLRLFNDSAFEPIELSPVSSFGSCAVVGTTSQNKILSAIRNTEVLADATNAVALHIAHLKKQGTWNPSPQDRRHFVVIQRHLRTQALSNSGFTPHFKIAALVTAGYDTGNHSFECETVLHHILAVRRLYVNFHRVTGIRFRLLCRDGYPDSLSLALKVKQHLNTSPENIDVQIIEHPEKNNAYYQGIQYKIDIDHRGQTWEIGDGGFVNWTQSLLQNKKERMFTTGLGFEFMFRIENGLL
ncbi:hypothetical protein WBG78_11490 [Chryseolinea sp. T2]|uniref:hypothetical protein n=1 Tax=Chryseolinea sp. T2 TaxID=3129255 RepID=UPI003076A6C4